MARLYANENFPLPVVEGLRRLGHDVLTVLESGKAGIAETDEAVLAYACSKSRYTIDPQPQAFRPPARISSGSSRHHCLLP